MKRLLLLATMLCLISLLSPSQSKAQTTIPSGYVIEGVIYNLADYNTTNLYLCDWECDLSDLILPKLFAIDPETQYFTTDINSNALVTDWQVSDDGHTHTFSIRDDRFWSDGEPITTQDIDFTMRVRDENLYNFEPITIIDDYTFQMTFDETRCDVMFDYNIHLIPSHVYDNDPLAFDNDNPINTNLVTSGLFEIEAIDRSGIQLSATDETMTLAGYAFVDYPSEDDLMVALQNGDINFWRDVTEINFGEVEADSSLQSYTFNNNTYDYIGLNLANPDNPQSGLDNNGDIIVQDPHPIFGDVRVRRALQHAINVDYLVDEILNGYGAPITSYVQGTSWAFNDELAPIPHDIAEASRLLEEAGWVMSDNDVLVANNALNAEDGTEFHFTILAPTSNERRINALELIRNSLLQVGVVMDIELVAFIELFDVLEAQTHDAYLLSWAGAFPDDPYPEFFIAEEDIISDTFGLNLVSYYNSEIEKLADRITSFPTCDFNEMVLMYQRVQQLLQDDSVYIWLYALMDMYAVSNDIEGFAPVPNMPLWNIEEWTINN